MFTFNRVKFGIFEKDSLEEAYYKTLESKAIEFANHLIILSDSFRQPLMQLGAKQEEMTTVLTGIDYPEKYDVKIHWHRKNRYYMCGEIRTKKRS